MEHIKYDAQPDRCQALSHGGRAQCHLVSAEGSDFCIQHRGRGNLKPNEENILRTHWSHTIRQYAQDPAVMGLREEIGVLRMLLDSKLGSCFKATDLVIQAQSISDLVTKVQTVVVQCQKLEIQQDCLLDQGKVDLIVAAILNVLQSEVSPEVLATINARLIQALTEIFEA